MEPAHGDDDRAGGRRDPMKAYRNIIEQILAEDDPDWSKLYPYIIQPELDPNRVSSDSKIGTLHRCAYAGDAKILKWCLAKEAVVDAQTSLGRTALHYACDGNSAECVRLLLDAQSDPNGMTLSGATPLHICCQSNSLDAVAELFNANSILLLDAEDSRRRTAEMLTTNAEMLQTIQSYRAGVDQLRHTLLLKQTIMALAGKQDSSVIGYVFATWKKEAQDGRLLRATGYAGGATAADPASQHLSERAEVPSSQATYVPAYAQAMTG